MVDKKGHAQQAEAYLEYLWKGRPGERCPELPAAPGRRAAEEIRNLFPPVKTFTVDEVFGGANKAFAGPLCDGGSLTRFTSPSKRWCLRQAGLTCQGIPCRHRKPGKVSITTSPAACCPGFGSPCWHPRLSLAVGPKAPRRHGSPRAPPTGLGTGWIFRYRLSANAPWRRFASPYCPSLLAAINAFSGLIVACPCPLFLSRERSADALVDPFFVPPTGRRITAFGDPSCRQRLDRPPLGAPWASRSYNAPGNRRRIDLHHLPFVVRTL